MLQITVIRKIFLVFFDFFSDPTALCPLGKTKKESDLMGTFHKAGLPAENIVGRWLAAAENTR